MVILPNSLQNLAHLSKHWCRYPTVLTVNPQLNQDAYEIRLSGTRNGETCWVSTTIGGFALLLDKPELTVKHVLNAALKRLESELDLLPFRDWMAEMKALAEKVGLASGEVALQKKEA